MRAFYVIHKLFIIFIYIFSHLMFFRVFFENFKWILRYLMEVLFFCLIFQVVIHEMFTDVCSAKRRWHRETRGNQAIGHKKARYLCWAASMKRIITTSSYIIGVLSEFYLFNGRCGSHKNFLLYFFLIYFFTVRLSNGNLQLIFIWIL